jgi:opacity protein-like surface antigen
MRNLKWIMQMTLRSLATITFLFLSGSLGLAQSASDSNQPAAGSPAQAESAQAAAATSGQAQNPPTETEPPMPAPTPAPTLVPKWQAFFGYSFFHAGIGRLNGTNFDVDLHIYPKTLVPQTNFNSWSAELQHNFGRWVGGVVDFSTYSGKPFTGLDGVGNVPTENSYTILAGPVISYRAKSRAVPYVHALFGWNHASLSAGPLTGTSVPVLSAGSSFTDFTMALGGGVDYKITQRVAFRVGQLEWFRTSVDLNSFYGDALGVGLFQGFESKERNLRLSSGVVVNF